MGAWGPGIFSDDTAADIRTDYRELVEDQVPDHEAVQQVIERYRHLDDDESHILWLALAATQSALGRLDDHVKARALAVIDGGVGLEVWEDAGPKALERRRAALAKLRAQLVGPQPPRRTLRRPWRHETDLRAGDVLALAAGTDGQWLLRVDGIDDQRVGAAPVVVVLDWQGRSVPDPQTIAGLQARAAWAPGFPWHGERETMRVARHRRNDPDWADVGFTLVARVPGPAEGLHGAEPPSMHLDWSQLVHHLEHGRPRT